MMARWSLDRSSSGLELCTGPHLKPFRESLYWEWRAWTDLHQEVYYAFKFTPRLRTVDGFVGRMQMTKYTGTGLGSGPIEFMVDVLNLANPFSNHAFSYTYWKIDTHDSGIDYPLTKRSPPYHGGEITLDENLLRYFKCEVKKRNIDDFFPDSLERLFNPALNYVFA